MGCWWVDTANAVYWCTALLLTACTVAYGRFVVLVDGLGMWVWAGRWVVSTGPARVVERWGGSIPAPRWHSSAYH